MGRTSAYVGIKKGSLLTGSPLAAAIERRARAVGSLLRERRTTALALRRTQDERYRTALENLDKELIKYQINIPAIQQRQVMSNRCRDQPPAASARRRGRA